MKAACYDGDDSDIERRKFEAKLIVEGVDGGFGGVVVALPWEWRYSCNGADGDDCAFGGDEKRDEGLGYSDEREDVELVERADGCNIAVEKRNGVA